MPDVSVTYAAGRSIGAFRGNARFVCIGNCTTAMPLLHSPDERARFHSNLCVPADAADRLAWTAGGSRRHDGVSGDFGNGRLASAGAQRHGVASAIRTAIVSIRTEHRIA